MRLIAHLIAMVDYRALFGIFDLARLGQPSPKFALALEQVAQVDLSIVVQRLYAMSRGLAFSIRKQREDIRVDDP